MSLPRSISCKTAWLRFRRPWRSEDKLAFALNRIGTANEEAEARAYVREAGYFALEGCLLERPAYRKAQNTGHAVTETSYAGLNAKADALIQALIDKVG